MDFKFAIFITDTFANILRSFYAGDIVFELKPPNQLKCLLANSVSTTGNFLAVEALMTTKEKIIKLELFIPLNVIIYYQHVEDPDKVKELGFKV